MTFIKQSLRVEKRNRPGGGRLSLKGEPNNGERGRLHQAATTGEAPTFDPSSFPSSGQLFFKENQESLDKSYGEPAWLEPEGEDVAYLEGCCYSWY